MDDLKDRDVGLKHIILLTDGQAERSGYESTLATMQAEGITLSTVAVGEGADRQLLFYLAENGGGRYYATDVFTDIPSIFTKEAYMAGKKYLNNVSFFPEVYSSSVILSGIDGLPELDGYVATSKKDNARTILVGPEEDPILATWQYGLGRTMAWTPDMQGLFTAKWLGWEGNQSFWVNAMSWLIQEGLNEDYSIETSYLEGLGTIEITSLSDEETITSGLEGTVISPDGDDMPITIEASAPGVYTGSFVPDSEGVYMVHVPLGGEDNILATGVNVGYSPEFDLLGHDLTTPESLAKLAGGRLISDPSKVFEGQVPDVKGSHDLSNWLLLLALLIFIFEIVLRKTNLNFEWIGKLREPVDDFVDQYKTFVDKDMRNKRKSGQANKKSFKTSTSPDNENKNDMQDSNSENKKRSKKSDKPSVDTSHIDALMKQKKKRRR